MRRIGEVLLTIAVLTMVTTLTIADQLRRKTGGARQKPAPEALTEDERDRPRSNGTSRAESIILHVL